MKIEIDTDFLIEHGLSADEYVLVKLLSIKNFDLIAELPISIDVENLVNIGWLDAQTSKLTDMQLTDYAHDQLGIIHSVDLDELAEWIRGMWDNTKPGAMSSLQGVKNRLNMFVRHHPQYSMDTIKVAVQLYVDRERDNSHYKFLKTTVNFIYERDGFGDFQSKLADFCETVLSDEGVDGQYRRA